MKGAPYDVSICNGREAYSIVVWASDIDSAMECAEDLANRYLSSPLPERVGGYKARACQYLGPTYVGQPLTFWNTWEGSAR